MGLSKSPDKQCISIQNYLIVEQLIQTAWALICALVPACIYEIR